MMRSEEFANTCLTDSALSHNTILTVMKCSYFSALMKTCADHKKKLLIKHEIRCATVLPSSSVDKEVLELQINSSGFNKYRKLFS